MSRAIQPDLPAPETNTLGLAGFICALIGIATGGVLSPVGLLLSVIALGRQPRGFAIAGVVVGMLGSCGLILFMLLGGLALLGIGIAGAVALSEPQRTKLTVDSAVLIGAVETHRQRTGRLPTDLAGLAVAAELTDPWGHAYRLVTEPDTELGFRLLSDGPDGQPETGDDVELTSIESIWGRDRRGSGNGDADG